MFALYLLFLPPYSPVDPATAADATAECDYFVDDPYPYYRASRQAVPHPLSQISPIYLYLSIALGIAAATLHSYSIAYPVFVALDVPSFILCCLL